jgi:hypothetical protein
MSAPDISDAPFEMTLPDSKTGGVGIVLIGSSRSGKTYALKKIMETYFSERMITLMTNSSQADIYKEFPESMGKGGLVKAPCYMPKLISEMYKINSKTNNKYPFLVCLDDIVDTSMKNDPQMRRLLTIYRNSNMSAIISAQSSVILNSVGRTNAHYVFLFKLNTAEEIENAIKKFLSPYLPTQMKMSQKIQYYKAMTQDHHFFLINNLEGTCIRSRMGSA